MRIKKVFNNNVLLAEKNGREVVLIGKGIGFKSILVTMLSNNRLLRFIRQKEIIGLVISKA